MLLSGLTAQTEIRKVRKGLALLVDENSFKHIGGHARSRKYSFVTSELESVKYFGIKYQKIIWDLNNKNFKKQIENIKLHVTNFVFFTFLDLFQIIQYSE